jgi:hypothetical protein
VGLSLKQSAFAVVFCAFGLGLPQASYGLTQCSNSSLSGTYTAQVSGTSYMNALTALNSSGAVTGSPSSAGFADNPYSLGGSLPGVSRFILDGSGNIIGQDPTRPDAPDARVNAGTYSVDSTCMGTFKLVTGQSFSAVVVGGGSQVFLLENDADTGGVVVSLAKPATSCGAGSTLPDSFGFSFNGMQQVSTNVAGGTTGAVGGPSLFPSTIPHAAGSSFLPTFRNRRDGDLDVASTSGSFDGSNYTLQATLNAPIGTTKYTVYTWGIDRGTHKATLGAFRPTALFDALVIVRPDLTGEIFDNTADPTSVPGAGAQPTSYKLPAGSITMRGNTIRVVVPASLLPSKGAPPAGYTWLMAPVTSLTDNNEVAQFLPASGNATFALTGAAAGRDASGGTTGSVQNTNEVSFTPFSAVGSVQLNADGTFALREVLYQSGKAKTVSSSGSYKVGADCSVQLNFPSGGSDFTTPLMFRATLLNSSSGVVVLQPDTFGTIVGQFAGQ